MRKPSPPIATAVYGAVLALMISYALSYVLTRYGLGPLGSPGEARVRGPAVFSRSDVNLCAMHCVSLQGAGSVTEGVTGPMAMSAHVTLPLTIWSLVPALALFIGGYAAGRSREESGRWGGVLSAMLGGLIYAGLLAAVSYWSATNLTSSVLPVIEGIEFNPPSILFRAAPWSVFQFAAVFGLLFSYLGALLVLRGQREDRPGKWWACAKSAIGAAIVLQLVVAAVAATWFLYKGIGKDSSAPARVYEMLPTVSGLVYGMLHGATVQGSVSGTGLGAESAYPPLAYSASAYRGVQSDQGKPGQLSKAFYGLLIIPAVAVFLAGFLAVKLGSRDGSVPTALRILLLHSAWLLVLLRVCRIEAGMVSGTGPLRSSFEWFGGPVYDPIMIYCGAVVFVLAMVGAQIGGARRGGWDGL